MVEVITQKTHPDIDPAIDYINHIDKSDTWRVKVRDKETGRMKEVGRPIITHEAVERIARIYGIRIYKYEWYKTDIDDMMIMIEVTGFWEDGRITPEVGECSSRNAGQIGGNYPHSMAFKRGFDRAVLKHLGIEAYSAEEADDFVIGDRDYVNNQPKALLRQSNASETAQTTPQPAAEPQPPKQASDSQQEAIRKSIKLLQLKGKDIALETFLQEHFNKSRVEELTFDEAIQAIQECNALMSS